MVQLRNGMLNAEIPLLLPSPLQVQQIDRVVEVVEETLKGGLVKSLPLAHSDVFQVRELQHHFAQSLLMLPLQATQFVSLVHVVLGAASWEEHP